MSDLHTAVKDGFSGKTVVIVGDLVADQFLHGTISRVSREAPVFILRHEHTVTLPGAAANAAANVASLGGNTILIGFTGEDANGELLRSKLTEMGVADTHIATVAGISTTTKVRVLAGQHYAARQQVIRIDYEDPRPVREEIKKKLVANLSAAAATADAIIVSDYHCGAVFPEIFESAKDMAREKSIPLIVDSRYRLPDFSGATTATPNREEVEAILGENFTARDCSALGERLGCEALLVTNGNEGMVLLEKDKAAITLEAVGPKEPVDVTGAGDTVIAAYALGLAAGLGFADAARIANHAGGIVVMKKGTAVVTLDELCESLIAGASQISKHAT
jgi:D-glycero-beta-D-manno-heptose-7-phosphate kinase